MPRPLICVMVALAAAVPAHGQIAGNVTRPVAHAVRTPKAPVIDGRLDDSVWAAAPVISRLVQHEPFDGTDATESTEVRILFDGRNIYIGARLHDRDPSGIIRGEARRDLVLKEQDAFMVLLDTFHDRQNGFLFGTTPAGVEHDSQINKEGEGGFGGPVTNAPSVTGGNENIAWDGTWRVRTSVDEQGWSAEFEIPFETLRYGSGKPQTWGLNFARYIRRKNEEDFWSPVPRQHTLFRVSMAGSLEGIETPSKQVATVTPYVLGSVSRDYVNASKADRNAEFGVDAKIGLTPSVTMDLTYNTDFAQVEVDEQQVNLTRFNLFFPEKRPFFLENAGVFAFGTPQSMDLFFSRRIGINGDRSIPILGGARLSGRTGPVSFGFLDVQTKAIDDPAGGRVDPNNYSVGRVVYELPHRSRVGAVLVDRIDTDSSGNHNLAFGVDGKLGLGEAVSIDGYLAHTVTPGETRSANAFNLSGTYTTRKWEVGSAVRQVDEGFNPEAGYLERPSFRFYSLRVLRHLRTPHLAWFRETRPHITFRQYDDVNGRPQSRLIHIDSHFLFANGSFFELPGINLTREVLTTPFEISKGVSIPAGLYDHFEWSPSYNTNLSAPYSLSGTITIGGFYTGKRVGATASLVARPNEKMNATLKLGYDDVRLPEGHFRAKLIGLKLAYLFTPRIFLQSLTQYNNQTDRFAANLRFGWLGPAGTGLFVVYNEGRATGEDSGLVDRAFVVKFTRQLNLAR